MARLCGVGNAGVFCGTGASRGVKLDKYAHMLGFKGVQGAYYTPL